MIGSKLTRVTVSTLLSSIFSNHFYLQQQVVSGWLRACAMNWAWKQWNSSRYVSSFSLYYSLSKSSITNSKHKPQARQFFFFIIFLTQLNKTKQKDRNLYASPPNLNQTLSSMLKMILSNICLQWKESKILICTWEPSRNKQDKEKEETYLDQADYYKF